MIGSMSACSISLPWRRLTLAAAVLGGLLVWEGAEGPATAGEGAFPVALGGAFELTDHLGQRRSSATFEGRYRVILFGCVRCAGIMGLAMDNALAAVDLLRQEGKEVLPLLITVDPAETPEVLGEEIPKIHANLVGLTGSAEELASVRKLFKVNVDFIGTSIEGKHVFATQSFVYFVGPEGEFLTLLPPILTGAAMAEKLRRYFS